MNISTTFRRAGFPDIVYGPKNFREPKICHNPVVLLDPSTGKTITTPCGSWKCPVCSRVHKRKLEKKIHIAIEGKNVRHLVLTLKNDENMMQKWNNFKTQLRKRGFLKEYVWVKEFQERGARHLHILIFEFIRHELINRYWDGISSIGFVRGSKNYITKYLGSVDQQELFGPGEKRYSTSRGFFEPQQCSLKMPGYSFVRLTSESYIECTREHFEQYYKMKEIFINIVKDLHF